MDAEGYEPSPEPAPEPAPRSVKGHLLAILTVIAMAFALKETSSVTLPLAFGLFCACLLWPVMRVLSKVLPRGLAATFATLAFLGVCVAFFAGLGHTGSVVTSRLTESGSRLRESLAQLEASAASAGLPVDQLTNGGGSGMVREGGKVGFEILAGAFLVVAFLSLGLFEAREARIKVRRASRSSRRARRFLEVTDRVSKQFRRYFWVRTLVGAITGGLVAVGAWAIGLELWWLWGALNFLLNYIPTIGSVIGVLPPTLYALVQFQGDWGMAAAAIAVVGGVQLVMGNWIDPLMQGKALELSPLVVLFSIAFWGWVWGVAGALIGVPLTVLVVLVAREFEKTRWLAVLLAGLGETGADDETDP
ncbi:MAG TPA: AI-2E family transporter [Sandaracinaceae bacterium LLY-WYZ-13_1]|nr:AI-2E family transporter [Sandaracinaceae bacterium LLY-WYZ-13_1]